MNSTDDPLYEYGPWWQCGDLMVRRYWPRSFAPRPPKSPQQGPILSYRPFRIPAPVEEEE